VFLMKKDIRRRARLRLDERLARFHAPSRLTPPPKGWISAIREALGMTGVQLARRLHMRPQTLQAIEKSEANGSIQISTLRRVAEGLDCTLVYALVPHTSLEEMVQQRARAIAIGALTRVAHTMRLEAQETDDKDWEDRINAYVRDIIRDRDLWKES